MNGSLIVVDSPLDAVSTRERVAREITAAGNTVFADLDQAALARGAGLELRPTYVVIFGNPRAGTPLMVASALAAYELPLKVLIWSEGDQTRVAYRPPSLMTTEYPLAEQNGRLAAMDAALAGIVERALSST
jgi:uncharacterized protein (DUF302 family)